MSEQISTCVYCGNSTGFPRKRYCSRCGAKLKLIRTMKAMVTGQSYKDTQKEARKAIKEAKAVKEFADKVLEKSWGQLWYFQIKEVLNATLEEAGITTNG